MMARSRFCLRLIWLYVITFLCSNIGPIWVISKYIPPDFSNVPDTGNYSCDELTRWLGTEKHYSNDKKEVLFRQLVGKDCMKSKAPVIFLNNMNFGYNAANGKRLFFKTKRGEKSPCTSHDDYAVAYLSNFSINNNFSHFLHGLLRLFCALIDARWIAWNSETNRFVQRVNYTIWLDEYFKISEAKLVWMRALGANVRSMGKALPKGTCVSSSTLLYGSGCVKLLPPEKWHGYPKCRAAQVLPAFGHYMREKFSAATAKDLILIDEKAHYRKDPGLRVAFAVRDVGDLTGRRIISNLGYVQTLARNSQFIRTSTENVTFEHLDVPSTIRYMAGVHIFVSVHGAGMTNMFFMNPGSAVVEIIPYPLCNCRSPDYFYGVGGYYHGSAVAQRIKHYPYCVPAEDTIWHAKPEGLRDGMKCSWKHLHAVDSMRLDPMKFVSLLRNVERDLVVEGTVELTMPIIAMSPHANG